MGQSQKFCRGWVNWRSRVVMAVWIFIRKAYLSIHLSYLISIFIFRFSSFWLQGWIIDYIFFVLLFCEGCSKGLIARFVCMYGFRYNRSQKLEYVVPNHGTCSNYCVNLFYFFYFSHFFVAVNLTFHAHIIYVSDYKNNNNNRIKCQKA